MRNPFWERKALRNAVNVEAKWLDLLIIGNRQNEGTKSWKTVDTVVRNRAQKSRDIQKHLKIFQRHLKTILNVRQRLKKFRPEQRKGGKYLAAEIGATIPCSFMLSSIVKTSMLTLSVF